MSVPPSAEDLWARVPARLGVYLLKDDRHHMLYIGKARDLRARIRTHLSAAGGNPKALVLSRRIAHVDFIPCETEAEALVLEQNLIKEHRPRYNVEMKDDKRYPYLKLTREPFPRLFKTRTVDQDGARYFGPYTSVSAMEQMLKSLQAIFPLRSCDYQIPFTDPVQRECLEYHIGRCEAPCTRRVDQPHYARMVEQVELFLEGHTGQLLDSLERQMEEAAEQQHYEQAARLRDRGRAIRRATERQRVITAHRVDFDLATVVRQGGSALGLLYRVREGRLVGRDTYALLTPLDQEDEQVIQALVLRHYLRTRHVPPRLYLGTRAQDQPLLAQVLGKRRGLSVQVRLARQGAPAQLLEMARADGRYRLQQNRMAHPPQAREIPRGASELQRELDLPRPPLLIEAFDVSHLQGTDAVAAMVCFFHGRPLKKRYRRFRLKGAAGGDDPAGIAEAVQRHYRRIMEQHGEQELPDLVVIDGGGLQLAAAVHALERVGVDQGRLPVLGLAKRREELWIPGVEGPQSLRRHSAALHLLQRIRDEVHRYALGYHRRRRSGHVRATLLTDVPGVGPSRARLLLSAFGSVHRMLQAGQEAVARLPGIGPVTARRIFDAMAPDDAR